jgi:release factor glutamine methyltransferase
MCYRAGVDVAWTPLKVLDWTTSRFERAGLDSPRLDAQVLLAHVLGCDRVGLYTQFDKPLADEELSSYRGLIRRRLAGEPVAYLVGEQEFWSLPLKVGPEVLIPRRDSEAVIEVVLDTIGEREAARRVLDVATGSGALALALATELPRAEVIATDVSEAALAVAAVNAERCGVADRVTLRQGDLLAPVAGQPPFEVVVANLPYVPSAEVEILASEVRREPAHALDGGPDGLDLIRRLVSDVPGAVSAGGLVALEHGWDQGAAVRELIARTSAFEPAETRRDLGGNERVTAARRRRRR